MLPGVLYGVGVGPGDSLLITEKGRKALAASTAICVPKSKAERESVALKVVRPFLPEGVSVVELLFPMTHNEDELTAHWAEAAEKVAALLVEHRAVSFLTIGDPFLYSTFGYLLQHLRQTCPQVRVEVIPGVSSFNAAAALIQIPLVEKNERLAVVPVPLSLAEFSGLAQYVDTVVFLKVSAAYDQTLDLLEKSGFAGEAYLVSRCGGVDEFWTNDPFSLRGQTVDYLSLLIVKRRKS
ncbi:MAG: precorrin-2 C(20)-methyltransferase [Dethiobacter sp.]|jgi:precorrin-2/cobalt-factor-2 C20-methyltransferase|nr:precorrin-2 C(20)-methyltransferase [Dethiobacter sp.]MBS3900527.1 precorrin-2 C(20)-methyltransferase [Dethiobacter sp.]MBS3989367.1 precorrin-2 C(20)-methyltransferase [Dethiobacter sp.]